MLSDGGARISGQALKGRCPIVAEIAQADGSLGMAETFIKAIAAAGADDDLAEAP